MTISPIEKMSLQSFPEDVIAKNLVNIISFKNGLVCADAGMHDLKILTAEGKYIKTVGRKGRGPSDLLLPSFMCESKDRLIVYEMMNRRFSYFSANGKFLKIEKPKINRRLDLMRSLSDGRVILEIYDVDANEKKRKITQWRILNLYSSEMKFIKTLYRQKENRYHQVNKPPFQPIAIPFAATLCWDILPSDKLVVGFSEKYEFKIINVDTGETKRVVRDYQPLKVTSIDKRKSFESWIYNEGHTVKRGSNKDIRDNVRFPEFKPAYNGILTDKSGHILVFVTINQDNLKKFNNFNCFDAFDKDGHFINHVKIVNPYGIEVSSIIKTDNPNVFWTAKGAEDDALDIHWTKFRVK